MEFDSQQVTQPSSAAAFDFEQWVALAKADPEAFEARRRHEIAALIAASSPDSRARLCGLQWRIDMVRRRAGGPHSACALIFDQMWESVYGERGLLEALRTLDGTPLPERIPATIVELQPPHRTQRPDKIPRPSPHLQF
jgi:hypothetical protein